MTSPSRPSPAVYRRRRLVVFGGLIVIVIAGIVLGVTRPWASAGTGDDADSAATLAPTPTVGPYADADADDTDAGGSGRGDGDSDAGSDDADDTNDTDGDAVEADAADADAGDAGADGGPSSSAAPSVAVTACADAAVSIGARVGKSSYDADEDPELFLSVTNIGAVPCEFNVGTSQQRFDVVLDDETVWSSEHCLRDPEDTRVVLEPGRTLSSTEPVVWDRTRSSSDSCTQRDRPSAPAEGAEYQLLTRVGPVIGKAGAPFVLE